MHKNIKEIHYKYIANIFLKQIECSACMSLWLKYKKIRLNQNWKLAHCVNRQYRTVLKMSNFKFYFPLILEIKGGQKGFVNTILGACDNVHRCSVLPYGVYDCILEQLQMIIEMFSTKWCLKVFMFVLQGLLNFNQINI